jgi:hypothetical protein
MAAGWVCASSFHALGRWGDSCETSGRGAAARGKNLIFEDERDRRRKNEPRSETEIEDFPKSNKKRASTPEVGHALRAAYEQAVKEDIPPEMLDLLGKLG